MVIALVNTIGDRAVVKQRREHVLHGDQYGVEALDVEEGFLLTGKRGVRHILRRCRRTHGERRMLIVRRELRVGIADGIFQLRLERSVDNPLADLCACLR